MRPRSSFYAQGNLQQHLSAINNEFLSQEELHHLHMPSDNSQLAAPPTHAVSLDGGMGEFTKTNPRRKSEHEWIAQARFGGMKHLSGPALRQDALTPHLLKAADIGTLTDENFTASPEEQSK